MKLLGIDYGTKRIGLAVSDDDGTIAFPDQVIMNDARVLQVIALMVAEKGIGTIVIGESKDYDMEDNEIMEEVRDFAQALQTLVPVPVELHAEMMSSLQAAHIHSHASGRPKDSRNSSARAGAKLETVDAQAAAIILQHYIDSSKS